jgi:hypothetical protein
MAGHTARQIIFFMGGWISSLFFFLTRAILAVRSKGGEKPSSGSDQQKIVLEDEVVGAR